MAAIQELSPDSGRVETRPPEDEIEGDDEDEEVLDRFCNFAWPQENCKDIGQYEETDQNLFGAGIANISYLAGQTLHAWNEETKQFEYFSHFFFFFHFRHLFCPSDNSENSL